MAFTPGLQPMDGQQRAVKRPQPLSRYLLLVGIIAARSRPPRLCFIFIFKNSPVPQRLSYKIKMKRELLSKACLGNVPPVQNESIICEHYWAALPDGLFCCLMFLLRFCSIWQPLRELVISTAHGNHFVSTTTSPNAKNNTCSAVFNPRVIQREGTSNTDNKQLKVAGSG